MNKMLFKSATWTISYASVQKTLSGPSKTPVTPFDAMVLKSVYGAYLTVHPHTFQCEAILEMDDLRSVWHIQLASAIQLPQWLYQRPGFSKFLVKEPSIDSASS
jgi:gamma-tubulin complex component 2